MVSIEHKTNLILDLLFCIVIMPLLIFLGPAHYWWSISPIFTCLSISYFYLCYFTTKLLKLPELILSSSYLKILTIAILFVLSTFLLTLYPLPEMDFVIPSMSEYQTSIRNYNMTITVWLMFSIVICYSLTVAFIKELYRRLLLQKVVENQRDKAELALYKAQINPHFLFNTLNSIYSLVIGTSKKAEDAFVKFTELLRYTYQTADKDWVTIDNEINYLNSYIELQFIRLGTNVSLVWKQNVDDYNALIPPMIFLTFVENAFKYGTSANRDCKIFFSLNLEKGILTFETKNRILKHPEEFRRNIPVGIDNCRNRLSGLFRDGYSLVIKEETNIFNVFLQIDLNKNDQNYQMHSHR